MNEIEAMKTTDAASTPLMTHPQPTRLWLAETAAEATASEA